MINDIIKEAHKKTKENRTTLLSIFFMISMLELMQTFSIQLGLVGLFLSILLIAFNHGAVVTGLKITGQIEEPINPQKDGLCGLTRIKTLFSTYFGMTLVTFLLTICIIFVISLIFYSFVPANYLDTILQNILSENQYGISETARQLMNIILVIIGLSSMICGFFVDWLFFSAPFDLEMYGIKGWRALKSAIKKTKGYRQEIFMLLFHYGLIAIVFGCIDYLVTIYIPGLFISSLVSMIVLMLAIYCYKMEFAVAKAMLYSRINVREEDISENFDK